MAINYENEMRNFLNTKNFMGIQDLYEQLRRARDWNTERRINDMIKKEYQKVSDNITKFWGWNEEERTNTTFLVAVHLAKNQGLKTAQIRRFLDKFKAISNRYKLDKGHFNRDEVIRIRPLLAYAAGRNMRQVLPLVRVLDPLIPNIKDYEDFDAFYRFLEGIVAFHKFLGGD